MARSDSHAEMSSKKLNRSWANSSPRRPWRSAMMAVTSTTQAVACTVDTETTATAAVVPRYRQNLSTYTDNRCAGVATLAVKKR